MVEMLEHVQQLDNAEMPNARDVEDWLNLESKLLTSPQMYDEEILVAVVGDSMESESVCSDDEDEARSTLINFFVPLHETFKTPSTKPKLFLA